MPTSDPELARETLRWALLADEGGWVGGEKAVVFFFFFFFVFLSFLGLLPRHMEVPRLGV